MKCLTCKYWESPESYWNSNEFTEGTCHRYPPTVVYDPRIAKFDSLRPAVYGSECCGEYMEKDQ